MLILFKTLLPLIGGIITGMIKASIDAKQRQFEMLIRRAGLQETAHQRAMDIQDSGVAWTRRILAILFSLTLIGISTILVVAGLFNPDLVINVPAESYKHSVLSFIGIGNPKVVNGYIQLQGATLALPIIESLIIICESIVGFYFGARR